MCVARISECMCTCMKSCLRAPVSARVHCLSAGRAFAARPTFVHGRVHYARKSPRTDSWASNVDPINDMRRGCLDWRSGEGQLDTFEKCQTTEEAPNEFRFFLVHETAEKDGGKNAACSFNPRTTVWLVPPVRADARSGWLMVWKDNIIGFWKHLSLSWGMALCFALWYLWHRKSFLLQNHWHLRRGKQHTLCQTQ